MNKFINDALGILSADLPTYREKNECVHILEDANSPITQKLTSSLYEDIINKGHIDFGDIERSKGDIEKYSGFECMKNTINTLIDLSTEQNNKNVLEYTKIVQSAVENISRLSKYYTIGFHTNSELVMLEYNTMVYTTVEATSTLLYTFVDYMKNPITTAIDIKLVDTKLRANLFYFEQLTKFNSIAMTPNHIKMLQNVGKGDRDNFIGSTAVLGYSAIILAAVSIIPIIRKIIYCVYYLRADLSLALQQQASFLEMNKLCVESNSEFSPEKKKKVLEKQKAQMNVLLKLSDKLKVKDSKAISEANRDLEKSNKSYTKSNISNKIEDSPLLLV